jgi:ribonuclease HI
VASVGGLIFDSKGKQETLFACGIGETTNNQAETFALWKGILIMMSQNIKERNNNWGFDGQHSNTWSTKLFKRKLT